MYVYAYRYINFSFLVVYLSYYLLLCLSLYLSLFIFLPLFIHLTIFFLSLCKCTGCSKKNVMTKARLMISLTVDNLLIIYFIRIPCKTRTKIVQMSISQVCNLIKRSKKKNTRYKNTFKIILHL